MPEGERKLNEKGGDGGKLLLPCWGWGEGARAWNACTTPAAGGVPPGVPTCIAPVGAGVPLAPSPGLTARCEDLAGRRYGAARVTPDGTPPAARTALLSYPHFPREAAWGEGKERRCLAPSLAYLQPLESEARGPMAS